MICSQCGNELFIVKSRILVEGDTSPLEETKVFRVLEFTCKNPQCTALGSTAEERILLNGEQKPAPDLDE